MAEPRNSYLRQQKQTRLEDMIDLIPAGDPFHSAKKGRARQCNSCGALSVIDFVCSICNCANNKQVYLNEKMDCPKNFWTKLV